MEGPLLSRRGDVSLASLMVKQADDDVPHDRPPLFDRGFFSGSSFQAGFVLPKNGFVGPPKMFRQVRAWASGSPHAGGAIDSSTKKTRHWVALFAM